ncbi:sensor histidine kinase [Spirosoma terrae]|uniref:Signal transduction histidine kinase internal region domain-containing protein n=1 Tax=Spirosoma terrae TaxID=1968276 RepID=A0A6L9L612_9BACT|nr:histidine kinase [Spirosoma terrae]NDU95884.1 hypothetical protein [Spirosoma terrae]
MNYVRTIQWPRRQQTTQLVIRLLALPILFILVLNDGFMIGLSNRYSDAGERVVYLQLFIQLAIYYGWGYWLFPRFLYRFRPVLLLTIVLITYTLVYVANYAGFVWLEGISSLSDSKPQIMSGSFYWKSTLDTWNMMLANGPIGLFNQFLLFAWNFTLSFAYPAVLLAFKALYDNMASQVSNARLQQQNTELELNYLKSQINPHFLFNVLNSVYSLTEEKCPRAAQLVHQLSSLMQYTLYETGESKVTLEKELQFIRDYVSLEKTRVGKRVDIQMELPDLAGEDVLIAPFVLIPFVENAFKHGVQSSARKSWVKLSVVVEKTTVQLSVRNSKPAKSESTVGGLGLANARKRLDTLYPGHVLHVTEDKNEYYVVLTLNVASR